MKGTRTVLLSMALIIALAMPEASATCGGAFTNYLPVTTLNNDINPVLLNNTYGVDLGDGIQYIWCEAGTNALCYDDSTSYACYKDDTPMATDVDVGNGTDSGNWGSDLLVWYHLNDCSGTICPDHSDFGNNGYKTASTNPANATSPCLVPGCQDWAGVNNQGINISDALSGNTLDIETGESITMLAWGRPAASAEAYEAIMMKGNSNYDFLIGSSQQLSFTHWNASNYRIITTTANSVVSYGSDYLWTATYDASTGGTYIYQNGTDITNTRTPGSSTRDMTGTNAFGYYTPGTVAYKDYLDEIRIYNVSFSQANVTAWNYNLNGSTEYCTLGPSVSVSDNITVTLNAPSSITYYTDNINLNFTATSVESTFTVNITVNGTLIYENNTFNNNTNYTQSLLGYVGHGSQTITVCANLSYESDCKTVTPYIWHGINATVVEANGTLVSCYNLISTNGTAITTSSCRSGSTLLEWDDLPYGSINMTANDTVYDNESYAFTISESMGLVSHTFTLYRIQYFHAVSGGSPIGPFNVTEVSSGTSWVGSGSTNATVGISLRDLTLGIQVMEFRVYGYGNLSDTYTFTTSSTFNETIEFTASSLTVTAYDEVTYSTLTFNVTISNGTHEYNATNQNPLAVNWADLPQGPVTITINSEGYGQVRYYTVIGPYMVVTINAYLLSTGDGIFHSTIVLTYQGSPIDEALVTVQKWIGGYYQTTAQQYTDASGTATMWLDPLTTYYWIVEADGYVSVTYNLQPDPTSPTTYVRLSSTGEEGADYVNYSTVMDAVSYQFLPASRYQNDSFTASFEIASSLSDFEIFGWNITYSNGTIVCEENVTDQPHGSTIFCVVPNTTDRYYVNAYFDRVGYARHNFNQFYYWVKANSGATGVPSTLSDLGYFMVFVFIAIIVMGFTTRFLGYGSAWLGLIIMAIGVSINPTIIVAGIQGWYIIGLLSVGLIAFTILRSVW